jgi:hypothetical protein
MLNKTLEPETEADPKVRPDGDDDAVGDDIVSLVASKLEKSIENCLDSPGCLTSISGAVTDAGSLCIM